MTVPSFIAAAMAAQQANEQMHDVQLDFESLTERDSGAGRQTASPRGDSGTHAFAGSPRSVSDSRFGGAHDVQPALDGTLTEQGPLLPPGGVAPRLDGFLSMTSPGVVGRDGDPRPCSVSVHKFGGADDAMPEGRSVAATADQGGSTAGHSRADGNSAAALFLPWARFPVGHGGALEPPCPPPAPSLPPMPGRGRNRVIPSGRPSLVPPPRLRPGNYFGPMGTRGDC